jgi:N-acetylglucosamine kinase-like BadF-type ATPase
MLRIGVDGGATTTRAVVIDENWTVVARGEAGSSNSYSVGEKRAVQNVLSAIEDALRSSSIGPGRIESWGLGLAGAISETEQAQWRAALRAANQSTLSAAMVAIDEDVVAAQKGAFGSEAGAVCIAGTGANCFGINERGERARADGWGPLLGDRGSGYAIGEAALRAACLMADGCIAKTELLPQVSGAAQGDGEADRILRQAGTELALTAASVLKRLQIERVAVTGGVISRQSPVREGFEAALHMHLPNAQVHEPRFDAAIGAALLAV